MALCLLVWLSGSCATRAVPLVPRSVGDPEGLADAVSLRRAGRSKDAEVAYRRILRSDPVEVRAHVGLQEIESARGLGLDLRRRYRAGGDPFLAGRLEPEGQRQRERFLEAAEPLRSLGLGVNAWAKGEIGAAQRFLIAAGEMDPGHSWTRIALARFYLVTGSWALARAEYRAALWTEPSNPFAAYGLSVLADRGGDYKAGLRWAERAFVHGRAQDGLAQRLYSLANRSRSQEVRARVASLLGKGEGPAGYYAWKLTGEERYRAQARAGGVTQAELAKLPPVPAELRGFVQAFVKGVRMRYRHYAATGEAEDFLEFVDWARDLYERSTKKTLGPRGNPVKFAFVGKLMDATASSDEPLVRICAKAGLLLVLAQRSGGPPEAMLASIGRRDSMKRVRSRGTTVEREAVWLSGRHLDGYTEWAGGGDIAGLALDRLILIDLVAAAEWDGRIQRRLRKIEAQRAAVLAQQALPDEPFTSVDDLAGIANRLRLVAGQMDSAREIEVHEDAHLVDAKLHLPVGDHLFRNIGLAFRRGFSSRKILAYLERNAQLTALAEGPSARGALATCCEIMKGRGPHAKGYREIVETMVALIAGSPGKYPEIAQDRVIVQQLHKLPEQKVRALAQEIVAKWGLAAPG